MSRIVVVGEALIDLVPTGDSTYDARPGGGPANTAVALARLGADVSILARLSTDPFGAQLRRHLAGNGVDLSRAVNADEPSSVALLARDRDGSVAYRFLVDGTADWAWTDAELAAPGSSTQPAAVHAGSLALLRAGAVIEPWLAAMRSRATISIDPNLRPGLVPADLRARLRRWLSIADIIKLSADDLGLIAPDRTFHAEARAWVDGGPPLVVVTWGDKGATAVTRDWSVTHPAIAVPVTDTVGAGDAFTAGLLHELDRRGRLGGRLTPDRDDVEAALDIATRAAAWTCTRVGADPPTMADLGTIASTHGGG